MDEANLGGANALAGFLYQAVGVGALAAKIHAIRQLDDGPELRLSMTSNFALAHERFGQDAVFERKGISESLGESRRTFIQFKHSNDPDSNSCKPMELLDIVDGLLNSQRAADKQSKLEADFMLIMNRLLSPEATILIDNAVNDKSDERLGTPTQNKAKRHVLKRLHVFTIASESLKKHIDNYAAERGILESELEDRLGNLVFAVQSLSGGNSDLTKAWLSKRLTGVDDIRPITLEALQPFMKKELMEFKVNTGIPNSVERREVLVEIEKAMLEKPIVVISGAGGRGKTVIQQQILAARLDAGNCYVAPILARGINRDNWLAHLVRNWRGGNPELPEDVPERALRRLERACEEGAYPLLIIDIDGIDESTTLWPQFGAYVSQILDLACNEYSDRGPKISVILSCRWIEELKRTWPNYVCHQDKIERIRIVDFTDAELKKVVKRSELMDEILPRLPDGMGASLMSPETTMFEHPGSTVESRPLPQDILNALRHPLLWGCMIELDQRSEVLNGSLDAIQLWAAAYVARFVEKVKLRFSQFDSLNVEQLLQCIAVAVNTQGKAASREADWIASAKNGQFDATEAKIIYREAFSFGIIDEEEKGGWRWTHPFVREYLANCVTN